MSVCSGLRLPIRQPRVFLLLACWSFEILNPRARIVAAEPVRPIRESLTLPVDGQITKTLLSVDEYLSDARFAELTELLTNLAETHSQDLVPVSRGVDRDVNRYQNVAIHCQAILAAFPPEGLAASRKLLDPAARRWYEAWKASRDESHLERILRSAYTSSYGDNALWEQGELAWDRGDFELAASSWRQLMPREDRSNSEGLSYPDPEFPAAEVKARLILCDLWERNPRAAARKLREFRAHYPQETGKLAGGEGRLVDILDEITTQSVTWDARQLKPGANTFGGSFSRQHHWPESLDVGPLQWSARWPVRNLPTLSKNPLADAGPLRSMPVVDGDCVFLCDGDTVRGWRVLTGQPAWPNDQADPSVVYPQNVTNLAGWDNEPGDLADDASLDGRVPLPDRPCVGVPWQTLTIRDGKLFARLGSPVVGPARTELRDLSQEIICLDIGQGQGKLVWKLTNQDVPTGGPPWSFEGTPLVIDDAAFVVVYRRQPEPEFALLSLEAASGSVRWLRSIGAARPSLEDAVNRVSHLLLTAGAGRLYLSTDQGTIVSLSPQQGDLLWAVAYDSEPRAVHRSAPDHLQTGLLPPMSWQGMLFVAPNDSRRLYCLDGATGRVRWQRESPERIRQLVGIAPGDENHRLIVAGNSLHSFDAETGEPGWRITQTDAARQGYGQAVLSGKSLFWPTREMLFQIDPATGELQREIVLRTPDSPRSGGNLGVADGVLLVVEPNGISAYGEYGVRRERLQIDLSQHPSDPHLWRQLMELECGERNWQAAIAAGRRAWSLSAQLPPAVAQETLQDWTGTLQFIAKRQTDAGEFDAVQACYEELSALPLSPSDQARLLWVWSRLDRRRGDIATAVARLHQLLTLDAARSLAFKNKSLDDAVREQLEIVMNEHGRQAFQEVDRRGGEQLRAALAADDAAAVQRTLREYPFLEESIQLWSQMIDTAVDGQNWAQLWPLFAEWESKTADPAQRRLILEKKAAALLAAGYFRSAERLQKQIRRETTAASTELATPQSPYVAKAWERALTLNQRPIIPHGDAPEDSLACALLVGPDLQAWDRQTGVLRWRQPPVGSPVWAAYGETSLLLADPHVLSAHELETGELLWQRPWEIPVESFQKENGSIRIFSNRLVVQTAKQTIAAISTANGMTLWDFRPLRGKMQPNWLCDEEHVVLQTINPAEVWILDAATGKPVWSGQPGMQAWRRIPIRCGRDRWGLVTDDRQVLGWNPDRNEFWKYRGGMSHAHADPWLTCPSDQLTLLVDGVLLVGLDSQTGGRLWATGLADQPLNDPPRQTAATNHVLAAASQATLRAVSVKGGQILWEQPLPSAPDWSLQSRNDVIVASPRGTSAGAGTQLLMFRWYDGQLLQRLSYADETAGEWHVDDANVLWASADRLTAWNPLPRETSRSLLRSSIDRHD